MKMQKMIFAMGAALAAVIGASPASATIYTYTASGGRTLVINTEAKTGSAQWGASSANSFTFTGNDLALFAGGANPQFSGLIRLTGQTQFEGNVSNIAARFVFSQSSGFGPNLIVFKKNPLSPTESDLTEWAGPFNLTTVVPEPEMLGLFGAGAVMVMMGRRRRPLGKVQGNARLAMA
ncbi:PEP-CTERM sorting domain-containing protein [Aquisediminimonas sediminicola]|uniref:PEP-CTERM sorting domain-containing protein n=1 Tax=Alteraquisediminimonas sediminicola TaxID=2676787 RepID=UPI001C8DC3C7|nr:PEP-CTERM sorting domain-containing protein [Aquisediminimonas sediminicola]